MSVISDLTDSVNTKPNERKLPEIIKIKLINSDVNQHDKQGKDGIDNDDVKYQHTNVGEHMNEGPFNSFFVIMRL